jgi:anti-sigma regulatory factor (Ser/Thr protein kinase)
VCQNRRIREPTEFALNGNIGELSRLAREIDRFCDLHSLGNDQAFQLNLALEELFTNTLRHGGCEGVSGVVKVRLQVEGRAVRVEYADRGRPFDPTAAALPDLSIPLLQRQPGGLGIHLVRKIMPRIEYRRDGEWNRLMLERPVEQSSNEKVEL